MVKFTKKELQAFYNATVDCVPMEKYLEICNKQAYILELCKKTV
jgi:hypothetical protein